MLINMVAFIPSRITTVWACFLNQTREFSSAQSTGDLLGVSTSVAQILVLVLVMLGITFVVFSLSRTTLQAAWGWSRPSTAHRFVGGLSSAAVIAVIAFLWAPQLPLTGVTVRVPSGVQAFEVLERSHVLTEVIYPQAPPVGGNHAPIWQNCGFYDVPIANETAVHSLEYSAVWITYRPGLPSESVDALRRLVRRQTYVLVSPVPELASPVVASAWGHQLVLDSPDDHRLEQFVRSFRLSPQAPEPGGPCSGGVGEPRSAA